MPFMMRVKPKSPVAKPAWTPQTDRRHAARTGAGADHTLSARLIGGVDVKLRNVSPRGVLFESPVRLAIGAQVTLRLRTATASHVLPGEVVRCRVSATRHGRLRYETALVLAAECAMAGSPAGVFSASQGELMTLVDAAVDSLTFGDAS